MLVPHSASGDVRPPAVLIPLRSLHAGKLRLGDAVDDTQRAALIESMAHSVIDAAHDLDVLVVYDDPDVVPWAEKQGALVFRPSSPGLNRAITEGRDHLRTLGYDRVIISHADLPYADDLRIMLTDDEITIAPDRHRDGTNVMSVPTSLDFTFAYGPGSFAAHCSIAQDLGIEPHIVDAPDLAWDVDHPDDLRPLDRLLESE